MPASATGSKTGSERRAVVVSGGGAPDAALLRELPRSAFVVAADSGLEHVMRAGLVADVAVGDFDSVSPRTLARAVRAGTRVVPFPAEKAQTDLELAFHVVLDEGITRLTVVDGGSGRLDHLLGNLLLLAAPPFTALDVDALVGGGRVRVVPAGRRTVLEGRVGEVVSLFALGGPARGVRTDGLQYALDGDELLPGSTRGVSNVHLAAEAVVEVGHGVVLAVHPGAV